MNRLSRSAALAAVVALVGGPLVAPPAQAADDVTINLVGINDFHGRIDSATVQWAGTIRQLEADAPAGNSLVVSAGDNISASLFNSAIQDDNPTIDVLNAVGLDASATGNHEFDKGYKDLTERVIPRADFPILGANVKKADGSNALDPSATFDIAGVKVAVIGAVTQETPTLVSPAGIQGLDFGDPVAGINAEVARLNALPEADRPDVLVASFHEGAPDGTQTLAQAMAGSQVLRHLVDDTSPDVDAIFMGHTHQKYAYEAPVADTGRTRPIIQTGNYGENVGQIKLQVNPDTGEVSSFTLRNVARLTGAGTTDAELIAKYGDLAEVKRLRDEAVAFGTEIGKQEKGSITGDITRASTSATTVAEDRGAESSLGNLVADALLSKVGEQTAGADLALVNPGGLRTDLKYAADPNTPGDGTGVVTFGELNTVLPFANNLVSVKLSGASLKKIFEQQWQRDAAGAVPSRAYLQLGTSKNVSYTFDPTLPEGSRIQSIRINGEEIDPAKEYRVATFSFLAAGGDNFRGFKEGRTTDTGLVDRDGWVEYFTANSPIDPSYAKHAVQTTGVKKQYRVGGNVSFTLSKLDLTSLGTPAATRVVSKLVYDGGSRTLPQAAVTNGTSAPIAFTLPAGVGGSARVESTVYAGSLQVGTKTVVPLSVTGVAVTSDGASGTYGADIQVPVKVAGPEETPTGTVTLKKGDETVGTGTLTDGAANVTVDTEDLGAGETTLTVVYGGDANYGAANGTAKVTVAQADTTLTATGPDTEVPIDDEADIAFAIETEEGTAPTGTVTVKDAAGATIGSTDEIAADGTGTVSADASTLKIGANTVAVTYGGDDNHEASEATATVDVKKGAPTLEATAAPGQYGKGAVVTVTTDPGAKGLVYLYDAEGALVGQGIVKNGSSTITTLTTALKPGSHELDVLYNGSGDFDAADTLVTVEIAKATTTTSKYVVTPTKVIKNKTATKVAFKVAATGFTPTGSFTVSTGTYKKTVTLDRGFAIVTLPKFTSTGTKTVKGTYAGNDLAAGSTASVTVKVVAK